MKTTRTVRSTVRLLGVTLCAAFFAAANLNAQPFGQWDFDGGNLMATVGSDLMYTEGPGGATQLGTTFGSTATLGIPSINGTNAQVMKFPASTGGMGYYMPTPAQNGRNIGFVDNYTIILDLMFSAESDRQLRPLLETDFDYIIPGAGADLAIGTNNGVGVTGGSFDGVVKSNTWYRIGIVVATNQVRTYIDGVQVGQQNTTPGDRMVLTPSSTTLLLANTGLNPAAGGYVNSIQLRDVALSTDQMQALAGPSAEGIPQVIPTIPSYVLSWMPPGSASRTVTDIGAVINPGGTVVDTGSIVLRLNGVAQTGVQISGGNPITVRKPGVTLTAGSAYTLQLTYTDSVAGAKSFTKQFKPAFLFEDFEQLVLGDSVDEGVTQGTAGTSVWTKTPPLGWRQDDTGVPGAGDPANDGVTEWAGWSFANKDWWVQTAGNQGRINFEYGQGTVAITDPDEWDDMAHASGTYNAFLLTPPIDIAGIAPGSLYLRFDSSWDQEDDQTAVIRVSYNGGPTNELLRWDSENNPGPNFKDTAYNEKVTLLLNNPAGATNIVIFFGMINAANDWWWAIDNVEVNIGDIPSRIASYTPAQGAAGVGPRPQIGAVIAPGTTTINPGSVQLLLDGTGLTVEVAYDAQGRTVATARAPAVLAKLSTHTNTLVYADSLNGLQSTNWTFTVADYDEITLNTPVWMEEFNGVAEGTFPAGWVATNRTTVVRTNYDLGDVGSAAYENFVVVSTSRANVFNARRHNVRPATLNGEAVDALMSGNVVYGESDRRGGEQVQVLFSPVINLTGINNVKLAFNSIYEQNQDSMGAVEYSINGGATWLPLLYMLAEADVIAGDPVATLGTARADQAWDLAYNAFIGASVDASFGPYISGRVDDNSTESKRIEVLSMPQAANQANVRLRFTHTGTGSWYFGIDDVGIYGDGAMNKAPILVSQPQGGTIPANTSALLVAGVDPTSTRPLSFQWTRNGTNVPGATAQSYAIASMQAPDAGDYRLVVSNVSGSITSQVATLAYLLPEPPAISQDPSDTTVEADLIASLSVTATGTAPLSYQWLFNGSPLAGATTATLNLQHVLSGQAGSYSVVVTNNYGAITSQVATLTVLPASPVEITGQWDFDCGTLQATIGSDLIPYDATVAADTQFGTTTSFGIGNIGGSPARVLYFAPSVGAWGGYRMYHGAAPNGGGSYVNRYSVIYDIYYPAASSGKWRCFLQTNTGNGNDGDIFVNTANGIGISSVYTGTVLADTWHRIVFVFDQTYATLKKYIDGTLVGTQTVGGLDGRWTLDPYALLFADNDGDNQPAYANSIQFRNGVMTDAEVAALGGATSAAGIPGAGPIICSVTRTGSTLNLTWAGQPNLKLQKATSLTVPNWQDVPGSLGASSASDTISGSEAYYRLVQQP